jgi:hypothetical protein
MAVTAIWSVKGKVESVVRYTANPEKTWGGNYRQAVQFHALENVMQYTADEMKTEEQLYVSGVNCSSNPDEATKQFSKTKKVWNKEGGIVCFHGYQSFKKGEGSPEVAHRVGIELAKRMWGDRFEVLISTHLNTGTLHNHFCLNSVSFADGLRYYDQKATYAKLRQISDAICQEYGLSVIDEPQGKRRHISEIIAEKEGKPTERGNIRRDIDIAIECNTSTKYFYRTMESLGYVFERRGSFLRIRPDNGKKWFRLDKLGEGYTETDIAERLEENFYANRRKFFQPYRPQAHEKPKGLRALYLYYCYLLGALPKTKPQSKAAYDVMREDRKKLQKYSAQADLMGKHGIDTVEDLHAFTESINAKHKALAIERAKLRNKLRRMHDSGEMQPFKTQISKLTDEMSKIRRDMKTCLDIAERHGVVEFVVNTIFTPEQRENENSLKRKERVKE